MSDVWPLHRTVGILEVAWGTVAPAKVLVSMNISVGNHVVLPSGRSGVVVEPAGNPVIPCDVLIQLDQPEGGLRCLWANVDLVKVCP